MDHKRFRDWFSHVDELTAVQRKELAAVLSDAAEGAASLAAIELGVDDERRCPHCASADAVNYLWVYAEEHGVADRMVVVMGSDFGRTNFYNSVNGKDHWPIGSYVVIEKNRSWTGRAVGETDGLHFAHKMDPTTLRRDDTYGTIIYPKHVHKALRRYLGIEYTAGAQRFPFNNTEDFAFFS